MCNNLFYNDINIVTEKRIDALNITPAEQISQDTWERIRHSWRYDIRFGEETLTDLVALDLTRFAPEGVRLIQTSKSDEARRGTDLEILIRTGSGVIRLAIQAKKLCSSRRYDHLNAKVGGTLAPQIDVLEDYSKQVRAIPLYLLYNFVDYINVEKSWHCCQPTIQNKQFGCTFVPSWRIRQAIETRGCRNFAWIHDDKCALPWRCLFDCPHLGWQRLLSLAEISFQQTEYHTPRHHSARNYEWIQFEPVADNSFDWLWKHESTVLTESDITEFYEYQGIKRDILQYSVPYQEHKLNYPIKTVDSTPRRYLLVEVNKFDEDRYIMEHIRERR